MTTVMWFLLSAVFVDLTGYWLHRWAHRPGSPLYRSHMTHHVINYPPRQFFSETYRTSGTDNLAIWFAPFGVVYVILVLLSGLPTIPIIAGGAVVAILNSVVHDMTHISGSMLWRTPGIRAMGFWHRIHHSKMGRNFGILTPVWDLIFRTQWIAR